MQSNGLQRNVIDDRQAVTTRPVCQLWIEFTYNREQQHPPPRGYAPNGSVYRGPKEVSKALTQENCDTNQRKQHCKVRREAYAKRHTPWLPTRRVSRSTDVV